MNYSTSQPLPQLLLTALWIFPVTAAPIKDGGLLLEAGVIRNVLNASELAALRSRCPGLPVTELGHSAILPGLINLHTHLDYSNLAHLCILQEDSSQDDISPLSGDSMFDWLENLVELSRAQLNGPAALAASARSGAEQAALSGTTYVVDSTFSGASAGALCEVGLKGLVGLELFGLDESRAEFLFSLWLERLQKLKDSTTSGDSSKSTGVRLTVAPHAPYTVAPALWQLASAWAAQQGLPLTCHLAESDSEDNWIKSSDERLHQYLLKVMPRNPASNIDLDEMLKTLPWRGQGLSPTAHLQANNLIDKNTIAAHCLKLSGADIDILAAGDVKVALCPRSNFYLKNGRPLAAPLIDKGLTVGLGTDSLASSPSLDLRGEARQLTDSNDEQKLRMLTIAAARAVGLESEIGSIEVGKAADLVAFDLSSAEGSETSSQGVLSDIFQQKNSCRLLLVDGRTVVSDGRLV